MKRTGDYKSAYEARIADNAKGRGILLEYEGAVLKFQYPARRTTYKPDWTLPNGILVESKGYFTADHRQKMLLVRDQNPDRDIRLLFQRASTKVHPKSDMTYAQWAEVHGFKWAEGDKIPQAWVDEPRN